MIQIDEPALREGLPLKRNDWDKYLKWSVNAFKISSSIVDFVLLATFSNAFRTTDIMKPLKRNAMRITINELMIEPKSIPKNPLFHTSVIKFIKFSIII